MSGGAVMLLNQYITRLAVAEAFILGKIKSHEEEFIRELVSPITLEAARIRLEAKGLLNKENVH